MRAVALDQLFFFFQDLLDQFFVLAGEFVDVVSVLVFQICVSGDVVSQTGAFNHLHLGFGRKRLVTVASLVGLVELHVLLACRESV